MWYIDLSIDGLKLSKDGDDSSTKICAKRFKRFEGGSESQSSTPPIQGQNSNCDQIFEEGRCIYGE